MQKAPPNNLIFCYLVLTLNQSSPHSHKAGHKLWGSSKTLNTLDLGEVIVIITSHVMVTMVFCLFSETVNLESLKGFVLFPETGY